MARLDRPPFWMVGKVPSKEDFLPIIRGALDSFTPHYAVKMADGERWEYMIRWQGRDIIIDGYRIRATEVRFIPLLLKQLMGIDTDKASLQELFVEVGCDYGQAETLAGLCVDHDLDAVIVLQWVHGNDINGAIGELQHGLIDDSPMGGIHGVTVRWTTPMTSSFWHMIDRKELGGEN